ncbi:MAG: hypothetical protein A3D96_05895 [Chlamydiae bacterium RIFCSPHIGHO2_12_FULL_44_59]|nr:MAG: hypothetical protein A2796_03720 [Chlamydiae bacterium RIFCSPHIGHO2_01_FULL_44_39]OGN57529.1 MAG: hypothetical protein A3C42_02030 [Chlamydiae bacterium RIFCSPHIGHO2_02_FULL_45_9]OGN61160.1 MAG: hypothetical protein A3D96_05895 [Chlamydiae bacterium RIFCSPHIGHO2_12_FULL_44_59]OGN65630.1 MAG: hypothetical protein A2978_06700 [Chlamydiae bacterium RIFCSPLOWO2_01_FULL_44_52]OGN68107.1 MAG: hypothetical protein A3I67_05370 [Chlamydiae bacterium RIFCSPLOWO2_02_FULL_45_22]OGN68996.1 MAG: hyp
MGRRLFFLFIFLIGCSKTPTHSYKLAICAIFKNEAPWLKEWIVYHHNILGVEHFYLYNNESSDHFAEVLEPFIKKGLVELLDWDSKTPEHLAYGAFMDAPWNAAQLGAYNDCLKKKALGVAKWVAMIDVDEFIVPAQGARAFHKLLEQAEKKKKGTVSIPWRMFGTSGVQKLEGNELLTEKMLRRSKDNAECNKTVKSIHRPEAIEFCLIHIADKLKPGFGCTTFKPQLVQLNHYWTRTAECCQSKRKISKETHPLLLDSLDQVTDTLILQYLPELRKGFKNHFRYTR